MEARHPFHRIHDLPNRESATGSKIDRAAVALVATLARQPAVRQQVRDVLAALPVLGGWFFVALGSSALFAAGAVLSKVALDGGMSLWNLYTVRSTTLAAAMLALAWRPSTVEHMAMLVRDRRGLSLFVFTEAGLAFASMYLTTLAIELGPVSLASTVMASRPMFVFLFGIVLSAGAVRVLSEPVDRASLAHRGLAIAMIVAGIAGVSLL